jgi:hypothetical protein
VLIERRFERWKVALRVPTGRSGVFEALAEALAYLDMGGGDTIVEESLLITLPQAAVSIKRMPIFS